MKLHEVSLDGLALARPPSFIIDPYMPRGHVTLLGGHGGSGKSNLALVLAAHIAAGVSWAGLPVESTNVLFVSLEDDGPTLRNRAKRVISAYGLERDRVSQNLTLLDGSESEGALAFVVREEVLWQPVFDEVCEAARGCGLVIIDNASDAYNGDENVRRHVRYFMRGLSTLARTNKAAVLLLAHIDKAAARNGSHGNSYSGSTAWHNSARSRLALIHAPDGGTELRHEKCNLAKTARSLLLAWDDGVLIPNGWLEPTKVHQSPEQKAEDADTVFAAIQKAVSAGERVSTAKSGPRTTFRCLQSCLPELGWKPRRVAAAIETLLKAKRLTVDEGRDEHRNARHCYVPIEPVVAEAA